VTQEQLLAEMEDLLRNVREVLDILGGNENKPQLEEVVKCGTIRVCLASSRYEGRGGFRVKRQIKRRELYVFQT
jgi:hypothetical protein